MAQLAEQHGDVMTLNMGGGEAQPWVVLSSPDAVYEAFVLKGIDFSGRPMVPSMKVSSGNGQGFAQPTLTPELKALRRTAFGSLFDAPRVRRASNELEAEAALLADHLVLSSGKGGVELRPALRRAVTNMVLRYVFSARVPFATEGAAAASSGSSHFEELVEVVDEIWSVLTATPTTMADLLAGPSVADAYYAAAPLQGLVRRRDALLRSLVAQRRQQLSAQSAGGTHDGAAGDMLDVLLGAKLTDAEVLYTLVDLFVAGVNTVSTALEWMLLLTTAAPQVQARARADALAAAARGDDEAEAPAYVRALLQETMRAKPPLLLPRTAVVDSSIGGYAVRKGQVVLANNWALTHGARWWEAPSAFRPERWLEEERAPLQGAEACKFIPYSVGRRACPGSRLAQAELDAAALTLLRRVRWTRAADGPLDLSEEYSLTLKPRRSQSLCFERLATPADSTPSRDGRPVRHRASASRRTATTASPTPAARAPTPTMDGASPSPPIERTSGGGGSAGSGGRGGSGGDGRPTRRQRLEADEVGEASERLQEAGRDRRGGWRASKAKGVRRNRRYEKRLLRGVGDDLSDADGGLWDDEY